ncbi:hypothetical protein TraAM80_03601 [Trypanosoma rangeli]|uniref:Uncharacterized protein n=1 Tax=Trypanosoma rangeli TaxID=5698 RepID=A0A422NNB0_TRYRA|nr:uncharacterized protein TraAM80_03601 [Trypanosoma rangeli]RNF06992.1 hypothetical protein TraAM80_03601 [Trypanosoma rangeli]|eukprot:RNF06992.1 hypothetical protein TraAM80_03601 [Trypanosoma rangeli]
MPWERRGSNARLPQHIPPRWSSCLKPMPNKANCKTYATPPPTKAHLTSTHHLDCCRLRANQGLGNRAGCKGTEPVADQSEARAPPIPPKPNFTRRAARNAQQNKMCPSASSPTPLRNHSASPHHVLSL